MTTTDRPSAGWSRWFRIQYRFIRLLDPLVRAWLGRPGLADTVDLVVMGRRSGRPRPVLVGLLVVDGRWYVGHPNGPAQWTRNLDAAGRATVHRPREAPIEVAAVPLSAGPERSAAIRATFVQHPFPGNVAYRLARRHVEAVGAFYRLEPREVIADAKGTPAEVGPRLGTRSDVGATHQVAAGRSPSSHE